MDTQKNAQRFDTFLHLEKKNDSLFRSAQSICNCVLCCLSSCRIRSEINSVDHKRADKTELHSFLWFRGCGYAFVSSFDNVLWSHNVIWLLRCRTEQKKDINARHNSSEEILCESCNCNGTVERKPLKSQRDCRLAKTSNYFFVLSMSFLFGICWCADDGTAAIKSEWACARSSLCFVAGLIVRLLFWSLNSSKWSLAKSLTLVSCVLCGVSNFRRKFKRFIHQRNKSLKFIPASGRLLKVANS